MLQATRPIDPASAVRAQYRGYRETEEVAPGSRTPTFAALKLFVDNWRWQGVPFYLRSGKAMARKTSDIVIEFVRPPHTLFNLPADGGLTPNLLTIAIQPDEGIRFSFEAKVPDAVQELRTVEMDFHYNQFFGGNELPEAYERLLLDALNGDASLFTRGDEIEAAWGLVDPLLSYWQSEGVPPPVLYQRGTWGPTQANALLGNDGRQWHTERSLNQHQVAAHNGARPAPATAATVPGA